MISMSKPRIGLAEKVAVWRQLSSGRLAQGEKVREFEDKFARWVGSSACIAVNSGTSALHIGNLGLGIGPGDEVILPSFSFAASANSVALTGATPVFCDIEPDFFTIDPLKVSKLITEKTKAIMVVHLYGQMAEMNQISQIASAHGLMIIEDAAQAHGAHLGGRPAGTWGDYGAFSFYPTKNMTTIEGGAITTSLEGVEHFARMMRNQGMIAKYQNEIVGLNNRMTEISAVIGITQLERLEKTNSKRIENALFLTELLSGVPGVRAPSVRPDSMHVFHQYTVIVAQDRELFRSELSRLGIETAVYYPSPIHKLPAFNQADDLEVTDFVSSHCLSLPAGPEKSKKQLEKISFAIRKVMGSS